jgi:Holliday junction DNA helicase RuvA
MISRIRGVLLARDEGVGAEVPLGSLEISTPGGVVYRIEVPRTVAERLPAPGSEVELRVHHQIREDGQTLFGFLDPDERTLFVALLSAPGVGGKVAISLLSTLPPARLARAIAERDLAILSQAPGVGRKLAEKLAVTLSDKIKGLAFASSQRPGDAGAADGGAGRGGGSRTQSAVQALVALGVPLTEADLLVTRVLQSSPEADTSQLVRLALADR